MLLINPRIVILQGTGSQVTPGFPHSQICLQVASPKVQEHGCTTPIAYELASDTYYGLGIVTTEVKYSYYAILILDTVQPIVNSSQRMESYRKSWKLIEGTASLYVILGWSRV